MDPASVKEAQTEVIAFLTQHPEKAIVSDSPAVATLVNGLKIRVSGRRLDMVMDMSKNLGGTEEGPPPGAVLRAADAGCLAIVIAMKAASEGVKLDSLEVTAESKSDDRGLFGIGDSPAGPLSSSTTVRIRGRAPESMLQSIVHWAEEHSPVSDAIRRAVPMTLKIEIV